MIKEILANSDYLIKDHSCEIEKTRKQFQIAQESICIQMEKNEVHLLVKKKELRKQRGLRNISENVVGAGFSKSQHFLPMRRPEVI